MNAGSKHHIRTEAAYFTRQRLWGLAFITPALLGLLLFAIIPMLTAFYYSLTDYNLLEAPNVIGLANYTSIFSDARFRIALTNTFIYAFGSAIPIWIISLSLAIAFVQRIPGRDLFRTLFFSPVILGGVVVSIVWRIIYHPNGLMNATVGHLMGFNPNWLNNAQLAPIALIIVNIWQSIGFMMVIFIAGLQEIPQDFYDAARVDGANNWQALLHITLPLLKPTSLFVIVILLINGFQAFTYQFVMTKGGPSDATNVIGLYIFQNAFQYLRMGYAASISVVLFLVILVLTIIQLRVTRTEEVSFS